MNTTNPPQLALDLVTRIVKEIALHKDELQTSLQPLGHTALITIQVSRGDMGRVIGKAGAHSRALETLVLAIGAKYDTAIRLNIAEPVGGQRDRYGAFSPHPAWDAAHVVQLLADIGQAVFPQPVKAESIDAPGFATALELRINPRESMALARAVEQALNVLFNAIGKANGRLLTVAVVRQGEESPQPTAG